MRYLEITEAYMDKKWFREYHSIQWGKVPEKILASVHDGDGYQISIMGRQPSENDPIPNSVYGQMFITNPEGQSVRGGYWMNWPEPEWNISPIEWGKLSWEKRARMEVKQQATSYDSLKNNFQFFLKHRDKK